MEYNYINFINSQQVLSYLEKILGDDLKIYYPILYKIVGNMSNESEIQGFISLIAKVYQIGFEKSVEAHKESLSKLGLIANIKS
jgi:hypothetical protein